MRKLLNLIFNLFKKKSNKIYFLSFEDTVNHELKINVSDFPKAEWIKDARERIEREGMFSDAQERTFEPRCFPVPNLCESYNGESSNPYVLSSKKIMEDQKNKKLVNGDTK
jgi:hypothetical protein